MIELRRAQSINDESRPSTEQVDATLWDAGVAQSRAQNHGGGGDVLSTPVLSIVQDSGQLPNPMANEAWIQDYQQMLDQLGEDDMFLFGTNIMREF